MNSEDFLQQSESVDDLMLVKSFNQGNKVFFHRGFSFRYGARQNLCSVLLLYYNIVKCSDNQQLLEKLYHLIPDGKVVMPNL